MAKPERKRTKKGESKGEKEREKEGGGGIEYSKNARLRIRSTGERRAAGRSTG